MKVHFKLFKVVMVGQYPNDPAMVAQEVADSLPLSTDDALRIIKFRHPDYCTQETNVQLYRDAWTGGQEFVSKYLVQSSKREDPQDLRERQAITPCPAISKASIIEISDQISSRLSEVMRKDGPSTYIEAANGDKAGVDKLGSSMNVFVKNHILGELLAMGCVGVYIDRPDLPDNFTQLDTIGRRPYLYTFKREDILAWVPDESSEANQFKVLLLRENYLETDPLYGLPTRWTTRYRFLKLENDSVEIRLFNDKGEQINTAGQRSPKVYDIKLKVMPFVLFQISESLLTDIAMYQVVLMNMGSADISYVLKSNFPFYTEQYDPKTEPGLYKTNDVTGINRDAANVNYTRLTDSAKNEIEVGNMHGRRHPINTSTPSFIHPSSEPLVASMKKEEQLKLEIRQMLSLWTNVVKSVSTEEKEDQSEQNGLNNVGIELQHGECQVMRIWGLYDDGKETKGTVTYPTNYSSKTDRQRREEAKEINELKSAIPSVDYQKETAKLSARALFQGKLSQEKLEKMCQQIDDAETMTCDVEEIAKDLEGGLVSQDLASIARGYPKGEVEKAKKDQAERLALIQKSQMAEAALKNPGARGVNDASPLPKQDATGEKKAVQVDTIKDTSKQRGEGK